MKEDLSQPTDYLTFVQMPDVRAMQSVALTDRFGNPFYIDDWGSIKKFMVGLSTQFAAHSRFVVLTAKTDDFPGNENASGWITINYFGSSDQGDFSVDVTGVSGTRYEATFKNGVLSGSWRVSKFSSEIIKPTISCNTCTTGTAKNFIEYEIRENILYLNMEVWPVGYGGNTSILVSYLGGMFNSSLAGVNGRAMAYNQLGANSSTYGAVQAPLTIDNGILRIATSGYTFSNGTTSNINGSFQYQGPIASLDFTTGFTAWH
ncbi:hypothetical protein [Lactiplantibacillus herbarum]|uniref:hypothetical protein n=1 Tax=Lactiplantibacillus herbarum TaxID=1670446 RepID=UPI00064FF3A1|nr:hypothetical protein [Lactiplantibacillus herbarum]